jgi:ribosomal-protein-serine acetyltransferase
MGLDNVLRTPRLELRASSEEMFDGFWAAIEASLPALAPWMTWAVDPKPEHIRDFLRRAQEQWASGPDRPFTVFKDGVAAGQCSLDRVDPLARGCEIGYWLRSDLVGHGLMTEAASAVVDYAFAMELHRVELRAGVDNYDSNRIAEKLGFRFEGVLREAGLGSGGHYDMNVHGLLRTDARPRPERS